MRSFVLVFAAATLALAACGKAGAPAAASGNAASAPGPATWTANASAPAAAPAPANGPATQDASPPPAAPDPNATVVAIQFQRGANCWRYAGSATTFNGNFKSGQRLDITSTGEEDLGDGNRTSTETMTRDIYLGDARSGRLLTADADGHFTIPQTGAYQITFGPQAVVGSPGVMVVCTL